MKTAPDFTLKDTKGDAIQLSTYQKDKAVVLLFFPLAFSNICTQQVCTTRDNLKIYNSLNAEVIGISVDSFFTLKAFKSANNLNFTLLSDFNKEVSKAYNVLYEDFFGMNGVSKRAVFVIGHKGEIIHQEILEEADRMPDFTKVHEKLASIK